MKSIIIKKENRFKQILKFKIKISETKIVINILHSEIDNLILKLSAYSVEIMKKIKSITFNIYSSKKTRKQIIKNINNWNFNNSAKPNWLIGEI